MSNYTMITPQNKKKSLLGSIKNVILIASGKGGVGKSTIAANLATSFSREGFKTGLLDADVYGPSIPLLFDIENQKPNLKNINGHNKLIPIEKYGVKIMSIGLLTQKEDAMIWRGPMASKTLVKVIEDTEWNELDFLLIDLPPGTGDICISLVQELEQAKALLITTPQKLAVADARKAGHMFTNRHIQTPLLGIIENMAWFTPANHLDERYFIYGTGGGQELANEFKTPLIGQIPLIMEIEESSDNGRNIFSSNNQTAHMIFESITKNILKSLVPA